MTPDEVLVQLRGSKTDLGRFVEAMLRDQLPHLVVPANAVRAWEEREPQTWSMVCDWLADQGKERRASLGRRVVLVRQLTSPSAGGDKSPKGQPQEGGPRCLSLRPHAPVLHRIRVLGIRESLPPATERDASG